MNRKNNYKRMYLGESLKMPNKASRIDALWQAILKKDKLPFKPSTKAEKELAKMLTKQEENISVNSSKVTETE